MLLCAFGRLKGEQYRSAGSFLWVGPMEQRMLGGTTGPQAQQCDTGQASPLASIRELISSRVPPDLRAKKL